MQLMLTPAAYREFDGISIASVTDPSRVFELNLQPRSPEQFAVSGKFSLQPGEFSGTATISRDLKVLSLKLKGITGDVIEETLRR
jgi:hypothetical protein